MRRLRGCLIGCGFVSRYHLDGWTRQVRGRLVAVCDLDETRARAACQYGVCRAYTDAATMLAAERPDFVEICTRPEPHLALIRLAADHGAHVLCQKPIAPTLAELETMIDVCERAGVRFMVHENFHWRAWYLRMRAELEGGRVGTAFRLGLAMHDQRCLKADGLADEPYLADVPRLILYAIGPHAVDCARSFFGEPERVFARAQHVGPHRGEDVVHLLLDFPGNRTAVLDLSWATAPRNAHPEWGLHDTWIEGTLGTLRTRGDGQVDWFPASGPAELLPVTVGADPLTDSYAATQAHFLECLETGQRFATDGPDTLQTMKVVFAAYESIRLRQPVQLD